MNDDLLDGHTTRKQPARTWGPLVGLGLVGIAAGITWFETRSLEAAAIAGSYLGSFLVLIFGDPLRKS
ncbi:hypothetical protein AB4Y45_35565 [Paraburkholderia sp. EG287A]|uniref:hypothetical protein n=1 Tax=Paraburkholderia sp. EG287A TaxID=3237012 RepID=UPI0034D1D4C6